MVTASDFDWQYRKKIDTNKDSYRDLFLSDSNLVNGHGFRHVFYDYKKESDTIKHQNILDTFKVYTEKTFNCKINKLLRAIALFTLPDFSVSKDRYLIPHVDYFFDHKTLLYYVNDSEGDTIIFNEKLPVSADEEFNTLEKVIQYAENYRKRTVLKTISPEQGKAILFDGLHYHSAGIPNINNRFVININFQ